MALFLHYSVNPGIALFGTDRINRRRCKRRDVCVSSLEMDFQGLVNNIVRYGLALELRRLILDNLCGAEESVKGDVASMFSDYRFKFAWRSLSDYL